MHEEFDYIVVGSGAGGGPLACNLALAPEGLRVALLECGPDPADPPADPHYHSYAVPAFHPYASEDPLFSWDFRVGHAKSAQNVFYPRGSALGGSTAVHALITMPPLEKDWDDLGKLTGVKEWSAANMRRLWARAEEWQDAGPDAKGDVDEATGHGLRGWLPTATTDPALLLESGPMLPVLLWAYLLGSVATKGPGALEALLAGKAEGNKAAAAALREAVGRLANTYRPGRTALPERVDSLAKKARADLEKPELKEAGLKGLLSGLSEKDGLRELFVAVHNKLDANRRRPDRERAGVFAAPASTRQGRRSAVRERVLSVQARYPYRLALLGGALATRVVIEGGRAVGVEYVPQRDRPLYRASRGPATGALPPARQLRLRAGGEVVLAGGAFNTPQLLMLSGVGPKEHLAGLGIKALVDLPGVGKNLHDRYEASLVSELNEDIPFLKEDTFRPPREGDAPGALLTEWANHRGIYTSNGIPLCILARSSVAEGEAPDLCLFAAPGDFHGYFPCYSGKVYSGPKGGDHRRLTWAVLKAQTRNRAGTVRLRTADPRDRPDIQFRYFGEGDKGWEKDLQALVEGFQLADAIMEQSGQRRRSLVPDFPVAQRAKLEAFIKENAWGHHACGSCKIGRDGDKMAVLDGEFRVRGVKGLRVVDASVFPNAPGYFLAAPVYLASEQASEAVLKSRRQGKDGKGDGRG